ncbi:hypothetical protein L7F22_029200 [Adiantum nelumboides]|nr:hypothetical protein [Adiantum nelumboides]
MSDFIRVHQPALRGLLMPVFDELDLIDQEYTDDTLLFLHYTPDVLDMIHYELERFCVARGARINWDKSYGILAGSQDVRDWGPTDFRWLRPGVTGVSVEPTGYDQSKRLRTVGDYTRSPYVPGGAYQGLPSAPTSWVPQTYIPATVPYDPYVGYGMPPLVQPLAPVPIAIAPSGYAPIQNNKDNPPCNTLFIGNLGESTSEAELRGLFSGQPGFKQMKVLRQGRSTVCFIEFTVVNAAIAVHNNLQGAILASSDRGGMRLQYSKNPFGKRKDFTQSSDGGAPGVGDADGASAKPLLSE